MVLAHGDVDNAHRLLAGAIETLADPCDARNETLVGALYTLLAVCFHAGRADVWESFHTALGRLKPRPPELLAILEKTLAGPAHQAVPMLGRLDAAIAAPLATRPGLGESCGLVSRPLTWTGWLDATSRCGEWSAMGGTAAPSPPQSKH